MSASGLPLLLSLVLLFVLMEVSSSAGGARFLSLVEDLARPVSMN